MSGSFWPLMARASTSNLVDIAELPGSPTPHSPTRHFLWSNHQHAATNVSLSKRRSLVFNKPPNRFIAIGIDFGTTFSGISWAYSEDPDQINEVSHWPCIDQQGKDEIQVPTQYELGTDRWGYMIPRDAVPIKWFKLLLLKPEDMREDVKNSDYLKNARKQLEDSSLDVVDLIANYLAKIWEHALNEIKTQIDIEVLPLRVALTIPAIWPSYAREMMKRAAAQAGITKPRPIGKTRLDLVEEPEAAALATLLERKKYPEIDVGEVFIVCDCGGGTVDIISYKVTSMDPFRLEEAAKGEGKLCGGFLIDDAFETYMQYKSGLKFDQCHSPHAFRLFVNDEWEYTMKRLFSGNEQHESFVLRPPARAFSKIKRIRGANDSYALKTETIRQFYSKTWHGIRQLISDQKKEIVRKHKKDPRKILLVGGLGSSRYLYNRLQAEHQNVLQPSRAWSVVARGAVIWVVRNTFASSDYADTADIKVKQSLYRLPEVSTRISRFNYGVESGVPIHRASPPVDRTCDKVTIDPDGTELVWRMRWYLKQGEAVDNRDPKTFGFYQYVRDSSMTKAVFVILTNDACEAPVRKDSTVKRLCEIVCNFDLPWEQMDVVKGYRRFDDLQLTMRFQGEPKWSLKVGKNTVERNVDVQYTGTTA